MDLVKAVQEYLDKILAETKGMKVLLLDTETTPIVSAVATQSALLAKEAYLVDRVDNATRERMKHLKCLCFVRPSAESIQALVDELRSPRYGEYYLFFTNILKKSTVERLAEVDEHEVVKEVKEYFADYLAIGPDLYSLNMYPQYGSLYGDTPHTWEPRALHRALEGLSAVLLSLKKRPIIRYQRTSALAKKLGDEVQYLIRQEPGLFDFRRTDTPPVLLILDRRNDPVTPLLTQWTYQAMTHEELEIRNGRVDLSSIPDIRPDQREVILSVDQDPFFARTRLTNFGDLGAEVKAYVDRYKDHRTTSTTQIETVADMKRFLEEYPEYRRLEGNVSKHVTVVSELQRRVQRGKLDQCSELEQSLACNESHTSDLRNLKELLGNPGIGEMNKIRLVMIYALRYEKSTMNATRELEDLLLAQGISGRKVALIGDLLSLAGSDQRQDDLFQNDNIFSRGNRVLQGIKGVDNVFTQHTPHLSQVLDQLIKGRLKETSYPFVEGTCKDRPQDIILFVVGGATYEEARTVSLLSSSSPGVRMVFGGTTMHNSMSFLGSIQEAGDKFPNSAREASLARRAGRTM
ncbi:MAG: Sec1 family protein [Piptocephalis tieghemiana]|nr:MAG: Sec1 family protein [Piptocephalis tieghemiana]